MFLPLTSTSSPSLSLKPIQSKKDWLFFEKAYEVIYADDPFAVPAFPGSVAKLFIKNSPYLEFCEFYGWVAVDAHHKPVGRVVFTLNQKHLETHKDEAGFFGFFDFKTEEVARLLWDTVLQKAKEVGVKKVRGPYNPTINDECGLLVDGFDSPPMVMMPYNPAWYQGTYERLGLQKKTDLLAFEIDGRVQAPERVQKIVDRVKRSTGLTLRCIDLGNLKKDLPILVELYNSTLQRNFGYTPLSLKELEAAAKDLKAIVEPNLLLIAERNGVPAGFSLTVPDINEFLWKLKKWPRWARVLGFVWYLKTKSPKKARLAALGILPEYRNSGIAAVFYYETLMRGGKKFEKGELSWVESNNHEIIKGITTMGAKVYKTYAIYEGNI